MTKEKFDSEQLVVTAVSGGVYKASDVETIPDLTLQSWRVYEVTGWSVSGTTRHFSGYCQEEGPGRASTPIMQYDQQTRIGTTASGRKYQLRGSPSWNSDAAWVWDQFCAMNKLTVINDVSAEYEPASTSDVANS